MKFIVFIGIIFAIWYYFWGSVEEWEGFVYPDKNVLSVHRGIGVYDSLEKCRFAAWDMLKKLDAMNTGDYECGLNCEVRSGMTVKVCEETER